MLSQRISAHKARLIYALVIGGCFHLFIVFYEEPHLRREFGSGYDEYCARLRRWLPRL